MDIENEIEGLKIGKAEVIATSPEGLPVYAVFYGEKVDFQSQANYNSAVGARSWFTTPGKMKTQNLWYILSGMEIRTIYNTMLLANQKEANSDNNQRHLISAT